MISNANSLAIVTSSICEPLAIVTSHWFIILTLYLWTLSSSQLRCQPGRFIVMIIAGFIVEYCFAFVVEKKHSTRGVGRRGRKRPRDDRPHPCLAGSDSTNHDSADRMSGQFLYYSTLGKWRFWTTHNKHIICSRFIFTCVFMHTGMCSQSYVLRLYFNPCHIEFILRNTKIYICIFHLSSTSIWHRWQKYFFLEDMEPYSLYFLCHGHWWLCDAKHQ